MIFMIILITAPTDSYLAQRFRLFPRIIENGDFGERHDKKTYCQLTNCQICDKNMNAFGTESWSFFQHKRDENGSIQCNCQQNG